MAADHCRAASSGHCGAVIDNQRHLAPATGNIECLPRRKSIYVPLRVVRTGHCPRSRDASRFPDEFPFHPPLSSTSIFLCPDVYVRLSSDVIFAAAAANVKYKMLSSSSSSSVRLIIFILISPPIQEIIHKHHKSNNNDFPIIIISILKAKNRYSKPLNVT